MCLRHTCTNFVPPHLTLVPGSEAKWELAREQESGALRRWGWGRGREKLEREKEEGRGTGGVDWTSEGLGWVLSHPLRWGQA